MHKYFCDTCGKEIPVNHQTSRLKGQFKRGNWIINFEIMTGINSLNETGRSMNNGDLCRECIFDAVASLDERYHPAPPPPPPAPAPEEPWHEEVLPAPKDKEEDPF